MSEREELYREYCAYMCGSTVFKDELFEKIWQAARRTVSGQEARNTILHEVAAIVEGLPGDYRPWDCAQAITDMTRDAAPIPATELKKDTK